MNGTKPLTKTHNIHGVDILSLYPEFVDYHCNKCGEIHKVLAIPGNLEIAGVARDGEIKFVLRTQEVLYSFWTFGGDEDAQLIKAQVRKEAIEKNKNAGATTDGIIYGPLPCRRNTYSLKSRPHIPPHITIQGEDDVAPADYEKVLSIQQEARDQATTQQVR